MTLAQLTALVSQLVADYQTIHGAATNPEFLKALQTVENTLRDLSNLGTVKGLWTGLKNDWQKLTGKK